MTSSFPFNNRGWRGSPKLSRKFYNENAAGNTDPQPRFLLFFSPDMRHNVRRQLSWWYMQMKEPTLKRRDEDVSKHLGTQLHLTRVSSHTWHTVLGDWGTFRTSVQSVCAWAPAKGILQHKAQQCCQVWRDSAAIWPQPGAQAQSTW